MEAVCELRTSTTNSETGTGREVGPFRVPTSFVAGWVMTAQRLGMFPLSTVVFPHARVPLHIFEPRYRALAQECLAGDSRFGIVLIERGAEVGGGEQRASLGTQVVITEAAPFDDGRWLLIVEGESRLAVTEWLPDDPYPQALVEDWHPRVSSVETELLVRAEQCVRRTRALLSESGATSALPAETRFDADPDVASWELCAEAPLNTFDAQRLLTAPGTQERLELLVELSEAMAEDLHRMLASG
jgi:Lon protease-like protein